MEVAIVGTGYVGLTTGVGLAYLGHKVVCLDLDEEKISLLNKGKPIFYEPFLEELIALAKRNLTFSSNFAASIPNKDVVFITVGTPSLSDGNPDLGHLREAAKTIGKNLGEGFTTIVNKSTVPIGSGNWVESLIKDAFESRNGSKPNGRFSIASNPEFLREGSALNDTLYPDRVVIGSDSPKSLETLYTLYKPILEQTFAAPAFLPRPEGLGAVPIITTHLASAELIKYAANAFLALKISYINEIAHLAEKVGCDITQVSKGIGLDSRIGTKFLRAGIGWGGSCFGKDTAALVSTGQEYSIKMPIVEACREVNFRSRERVVEKLLFELKILKGRTIGLLGLAFKPHTDDLRDAPSLDIARRLIERGVKVKAHDPIVIEKAKRDFPDLEIGYCNDPVEVVRDSDALVLVTEWPEYLNLPWEEMISSMTNPLIIDGRNFLLRERLEKIGFKYIGFGK